MIKRFFCLIISLFLLKNLQAKDTEKTPVRFYSSQFVGLTVGETNVFPIVHLNNGIEYKKYTLGVGFGIDHYSGLRKVPLYLDLRYTIFKSRVDFMAFSYIGTSFILGKSYQWDIFSNEETKKLPGYYNEIGVLCKTKIKGNLHYVAGLSYCTSISKFIQYGSDYWAGGQHYVTPDVLYKINSSRVNLKVGLQF